MDCQDCAQAQARQEDGRGQSGLPCASSVAASGRNDKMDRLFKVSAAASAAPLSRSERLASTVVANGRLPPGCSPSGQTGERAPQGQGRQVERGDRCDEQHIGDDQRAFLAGAQASQRAGGKIAHGESDAECGSAQSDLGHVQGIAQAQDFSRQQKGGDTRPVPQSLGEQGRTMSGLRSHRSGAARPEPSPPLGRDRRAWPCGRRERRRGSPPRPARKARASLSSQ